jgi:uncharacterized protein
MTRGGRPRLSSLCLFLALAGAAFLALPIGHGFFPGDHAFARSARALCSILGILLLIVGSRRLLRRDGLPENRLALGPDAHHARAFLIGAGLACAHIALLLAILFLFAPFELRAGSRSLADVASEGIGYLTGNFVEELLFRGYLLIALAHWIGAARAIWLLALPFGLFHFPGLDAASLFKMLLTTGAMHFVYAYAWLAMRSLWAAVALHAVGNTLLHAVAGVDGPGALALRFDTPPDGAVLFLIFFGVTALLALILSRLPVSRRGVAWVESNFDDAT